LLELHEAHFRHLLLILLQGFLAVSELEETGLSSDQRFAFVLVLMQFALYLFSFIAKMPHYRIVF
jgi:hypothetical protein